MKYEPDVKTLLLKCDHLFSPVFFKLILLFPLFLFSIGLIFSSVVCAAGGKVEALQMPAWLEREGTLSALRPGMELQSGDTIKTGPASRILLRMEEGSLVKLGENAVLNFDTLIPVDQKQGIFEAALNLVKGAFRFTTSALGHKRRRQVDVRIGSITVGIRGTDIWGSSKIDKDVLCLIEGKISAQNQGEPEFIMEDPLSFYIVPKDKPALPVAPVPETKLVKWADETELQPGTGILSIDGQWAVNLMSIENESSARPILASLTAAGYAVKIETAIVNGKNWYRLRVSGFKTREDARAFAVGIDGSYGVSHPWIVKF